MYPAGARIMHACIKPVVAAGLEKKKPPLPAGQGRLKRSVNAGYSFLTRTPSSPSKLMMSLSPSTL